MMELKGNTDDGSSRASANKSQTYEKKIDMVSRVARLSAELSFCDEEARSEAELKKLKLKKELAMAEAEIKAVENISSRSSHSSRSSLSVHSLPNSGKDRHMEYYLNQQLRNVQHGVDTTNEELITIDSAGSKLVEHSVKNDIKTSDSLNNDNACNIDRSLNVPKYKHSQAIDHMNAGFASDPNRDTVSLLANLLAQRQNCDALPRPEPDVFRGDIFRYPMWSKSFTTLIEKRTKEPSELLYYLGRYTAGEAKEAVDGLLSLDTSEAYANARCILDKRYGNPFLVANSYKQRIADWPKINNNDGAALQKFSDFLQSCKTAMETTPYLSCLNGPNESQVILKKLPNYIIQRWGRYVDQFTNEDCGANHRYPPFSAFCTFIEKEARISSNPVTMVTPFRNADRKPTFPRYEKRSFNTKAEESSQFATERRRISCVKCRKDHEIDDCEEFNKMSLIDRMNFTRNRSLCRGCLKYGHMKQDCRRKKVCAKCQGFHPTSLHDESFKPKINEMAEGKESSKNKNLVSHCLKTHEESNDTCLSHSMIVPVYVQHKDKPAHKEITYIVLDDQSDGGFILDELVDDLGIDGPRTELKISTVLETSTVSCRKIAGLRVVGVGCDEVINLPALFTREVIPAHHDQIPRPETAAIWSHLKQISRKLMPYNRDIKIGMLLGTDCLKAIKPLEILPGGENDPYAIRTALGWGIIGQVTKEGNQLEEAGSRSTPLCKKDLDNRICHFSFRTQLKETINPKQIKEMFELDFNEGAKEEFISQDDNRFMEKMKNGIHQLSDGHFECPLPFREETLTLPDNRAAVYKRITGLRKKFERDNQYMIDYQDFMNGIIKKGYAEPVPPEEIGLQDGRCWYIPHHGIYHPKKPTKMRVVFDCSHTYQGESINNHLLQGPDLTNNLIGVLHRFRQDKIAFICDLESFFYQVRVNVEHRNFLCFYWWEDVDFTKEPITYRMTVHLFGAASSPGCANYALKATADLYEEQLGKDAADFIRENFYVDDGLKSVSTAAQAIDLIERSKKICHLGGFRLHKFLCNEKEVLHTIPVEDRSTDVMDFDINKDPLQVVRTLGVQWCVENDAFQFQINLQDRPLTRRGILSTVSSIFDPLGLVSPVILNGKHILQELCRDSTDWDKEVPDDIRTKWERWRIELIHLGELRINRSFKPKNFGEIKLVELHHFSDACLTGYGQCSYIKLIDSEDRINTSLVMAKSRVSPTKPVTIPRLELTAAVTSVKVGTMLKRELEYQVIKEYYWTDSRVVLGYVSNDSKRFHIYVANRVQQIRNHSNPHQWNYVESTKNPADIASRGIEAQELIHKDIWWKGPEFLRDDIEETLTPNEDDRVIKSDDPEVRKIVTFTSMSKEFSFIDIFERFSDWLKLRQAISVCLRIQRSFRKKDVEKRTLFENEVYRLSTVDELHNAEIQIVKEVQKKYFAEEIYVLKSIRDNKPKTWNRQTEKEEKVVLKKSNALYKLDPFIDEHDVIRIGGRIKNADVPFDVKFPMVLPKKSHVTEIIIRYFHHKNQHQGRGITHNAIRANGYWIIGGRSVTSNVISKCVTCKKLYSPTQDQKMCHLPKDRLQPDAPFTYSAVDYFGPWYVRIKRSSEKRYGVIFVCMASRAIHLEVSNTMDTDSFINAYRRFVCRRGPVRQLRSDRGSNFIGAQSELETALKEMDQTKITKELLKDNCDWIEFRMNVPEASHMGGSWERLIRSVRSVLVSLLNNHGTILDDESLRTFFAEAECIINSRPLSVENINDPNYFVPLTPNQILTMKGQILLPPPGEFVKQDIYLRKRWRRVQFLANEFWKRWSVDYIQSLQPRQKWVKDVPNLQINDIVLVKEENLARNMWKVGRVSETYPSEDGLVRKAKITLSESSLDKNGKRISGVKTLDRPVNKLVILLRE